MISGSRVNLRVICKDDFDWLLLELNKPHSRGEWSSFALRTATELERSLFDPAWSSDGALDLVVEDKKSKKVGFASYHVVDPAARSASIEISIFDPAERGKGYGLEAHRILIDYLFRHRGLHRAEVLSAAENRPEQKLLEKLGFTREGILRQARFAGGNWHDLHLYALLVDEWQKLHWDQLSF